MSIDLHFLDEKALTSFLMTRLAVAHAKEGFRPARHEDSTVLVRPMACGQQFIRLDIHAAGESMLVFLSIELLCPALAEIWAAAIGEPARQYMRDVVGGRQPDFVLRSIELGGDPSWCATNHHRTWMPGEVSNRPEAISWQERASESLSALAIPALDRLTSLSAVAAALLTERRLAFLRSSRLDLPRRIQSMAVLARAFVQPSDWPRWLEALRDQQRGSGVLWMLAPQEGLDTLAAHLESPMFEAQAARLRNG